MSRPAFPNQQDFYEQVWQVVSQIPRGKVATYGQIAQLLPPPDGVDPQEYKAFGPRWVGNAMAASPDGVPWQRVINSQGKISLRAGAERQRGLLEAEEVVLVEDKINLMEYQWRGPDQVDEPRQPKLF